MLLTFLLAACSSTSSSTERIQSADTATVVVITTAAAEPTPLPVTQPVQASATPEPTSSPILAGPVAASFVAVSPDSSIVAAVNPDSDSVTLVDAVTLAVKAEVPVGDEPGDRVKAIELQDEALAITQELGMRPLTERILARREILRA